MLPHLHTNLIDLNAQTASSNERGCMFWIKLKKDMYTPVYPSVSIYKWGLKGYLFYGYVFMM